MAAKQNLLLTFSIVLSLSGILATQVFMYFRLYPKDLTKHKVIVALIWYVFILKSGWKWAEIACRALDLAHSALICVANWFYLVENFANTDGPRQITWYVIPSLFSYIY